MKLWRDHSQPKLLALEGPDQPLNATATLSENNRRLVLKVVNPAPDPAELTLTVKPGFAVGRAELLVVAPGSLDASNTLTEPNKVRPIPSHAVCSGQTVRFTLPAISAGVLVVEP
jgi:alpha-L-arabinofuranosidase